MSAPDVIVVGVGTNNKWSSKLVRRATKSDVSHAWLEYSSLTFGGLWAIHAQPQGVVKERILDVLAAYPTYRRYEFLGVDTQRVREAVRYALTQLGKPYDYGVIINALKLVWWQMTGRATGIYRNPRELHCSELVSLTLQALEIQNCEQLDPEAVHPGKLAAFLNGHPQFRLLTY